MRKHCDTLDDENEREKNEKFVTLDLFIRLEWAPQLLPIDSTNRRLKICAKQTRRTTLK